LGIKDPKMYWPVEFLYGTRASHPAVTSAAPLR